ncbi:hypothetical protein N9B67_04000 [Algibacter sp.]|nr:hypothetical protein [Algibacter sp.]
MKKSIIFFIAIFASFILISCGSEDSEKYKKDNKIDELLDNAEYAKDHNVYNDAISYNDAIIGIQTKIIMKMLELDWENLSGVRKQLSILQEEIKIALTTVTKIYYIGDSNQRFKKTALKLFNFYDRIVRLDYVAMYELSNDINNEEDYDIANESFLELNKIVEKLSAEEGIIELEFQEAQKSFARENRTFIDPSAHPLQEEIDAL